MAVGLRYINAQNEVKAGATFIDVGGNDHDMKLRYDSDAEGVGGIFGMNISATDNLNIGMRYETRVVLNFETDLKQNDFPDDFELADYREKNRRDFPGMVGIGAEYRLCPKLTTEVDFNWYLQKDADWGQTSNGEEVLYTDNWHIGAGFAWEIKEDVTFNFAIGQTIWDDKTIEYVQAANNGLPPVDVKTENETTTVAFGFDLAF